MVVADMVAEEVYTHHWVAVVVDLVVVEVLVQ